MASKSMALGKFIKDAMEGTGDEFDDDGNLVRWKPDAGQKLRVVIKKCNGGQTAKNFPKWSLMLEILTGDDKGKVFWHTIFLSANNDASARALQELEFLGVDTEYLAGATVDEAAEALEGKEGVVLTGYRKNDDDPDNPWSNHRVLPSAAAKKKAAPKKRRRTQKAKEEPVEVEETDDDLFDDDEDEE